MEQLLKSQWHQIETEKVFEFLVCDKENGLDITNVNDRQVKFGLNILTPHKPKSLFILLLEQFHQPLIYILMAAGLTTSLLGEVVDSVVIFGVVLINAAIGFFQESKALKEMEALANQLSISSSVFRSGKVRKTPAEDLVPGDIVILKHGDRVPADIRLFEVNNLQIDESILTGESISIEKNIDALVGDAALAERKNMAYASTLVTYGQARGIVVAIGDNTEIGQISKLVAKAVELETPLTKKITTFSRYLLYAILVLAAITFLVGVIRGGSTYDMFMGAVALAVGAIPEGLPAAVTITLAIGVSRMAKRQAIIRKLPAVETLGSTTVICSDKTGTLTKNQMTVQELIAGGKRFYFTGSGYAPEGEILFDDQPVTFKHNITLYECLLAGVLCNDSQLIFDNESWKVHGNPTEGALIVSAIKGGINKEELQKEYSLIDTFPFSSEHKFMATLHLNHVCDSHEIYMKGAVEAILDRSTKTYNADGELVDLDKEQVLMNMEDLAKNGYRVLAFAKSNALQEKIALSTEAFSDNMIFIGIVGMLDPPHQEAINAVKACDIAGIKVKMITGDHPLTAMSIADQIGLFKQNGSEKLEPSVITGKTLAEMTEQELIDVAEHTSIFARVTPEQKLILVEILQSLGHIVAMTGDGVNDAPALKRADIGVAMGNRGTEVAKEAADMILTDDNFASIQAAVEEGRSVFKNLTKFIIWTLPTNLGEGLIILAAIILGVTLPILPTQILWINMTTAILLGMMLAFEPKEIGIMETPPRDPQQPLLTKVIIQRIFTVGFLMLIAAFGLFQWELYSGANLEKARTVAVNVFVMTELFYLFNCRSLTTSIFKMPFFSNLWLIVGATTMLLLQLSYTYVPDLNYIFQSYPLDVYAWGRILLASLSIFGIVALEKYFRQKQAAKKT